MADTKNLTTPRPTAAQLDAFLQRARTERPPRLVFAIDATASRQPTWDLAAGLQSEMFEEAGKVGLEVKLIYFRGEMHTRECKTSRWTAAPNDLARFMAGITCKAGLTQIGRALSYVAREAENSGAKVLVYVGDAMEESLDDLCAAAGELGRLGVKSFMFHEGHAAVAGTAFKEIARLTGGAYAPSTRARRASLRRSCAPRQPTQAAASTRWAGLPHANQRRANFSRP